MPGRVENDAGDAPKKGKHPNLPAFEPGFDLEAGKKRLGRQNRRYAAFKLAPLPDRILEPEEVAVIVYRRPGCPPGWWPVDAVDERQVGAAQGHRLRLLIDQERRRRREGRPAVPPPDPMGKLEHL